MKGLHLKSLISLLDENTIIIVDNEEGYIIKKIIENINSFYQFVFVPDIQFGIIYYKKNLYFILANVLRIKDTVIVQSGYPNSIKIIEPIIKQKNLKMILLEMSEFIKAGKKYFYNTFILLII